MGKRKKKPPRAVFQNFTVEYCNRCMTETVFWKRGCQNCMDKKWVLNMARAYNSGQLNPETIAKIDEERNDPTG